MNLHQHIKFILAEVHANIRAWWLAVLVGVVVVAALAGTATVQTVSRAAEAYNNQVEMEEAGRFVIRVVPLRGHRLTAGYCDSLAGRHGVKTAFGIADGPLVRLPTGHQAATVFVTQGFAQFFPTPPAPDAVYAGAALRRAAGLQRFSWVQVPAIRGFSASSSLVEAAVLAESRRSTSFDDALMVVIPPSERAVEACWVETKASTTASVAAGIGNVSSDGARVNIGPLRPELENQTPPEEVLRILPGDSTTLVVGAGSALLLVMWWYVRRQEWALYRSFGISNARLLLLAILEWLSVIAVPLVVGIAWGVAAAGSNYFRGAYTIGLANGLVVLLLSCLAVPGWAIWLQRASIARVLRGT